MSPARLRQGCGEARRSASGAKAAFAAALLRRGKRLARLCLATAVFVAIAGSTRLLACPVCFGAEETSIINGTRLGVLAMLAVTLSVQGGFVGFFFYLRTRAKRNADVELDTEWSELQRRR